MVMELNRYQYGANYIPDLAAFKAAIICKRVTPHQVEWQPGPPGQKICWLECPYCYGGSAEMTAERLPLARALDVLHEMADGPGKPDVGGVQKIVFAGYATDPLYSKDITALVTAALGYKMTVGFNTKAIHVPRNLLAVLAAMKTPKSYVSVSVDAGSNQVYNEVHGVKTNAKLYDQVLENIELLVETGIEVAATYLVNRLNSSSNEIETFLEHTLEAGVDVIRFAFAQLPRGANEMPTVPTLDECRIFADRIRALLGIWHSHGTEIIIADADAEYNLFRKERTLPCVARWVYPTVGYTGLLYPCSQTGAPDFDSIALGDLRTHSFWDLYYDYEADRLDELFARDAALMQACGCRCDRKEHLTNLKAGDMSHDCKHSTSSVRAAARPGAC